MVRVGQAFCALLALLTLLWLPIIDVLSDQIFLYKEAVMAYLAPPIVSVYLLGPFPLLLSLLRSGGVHAITAAA